MTTLAETLASLSEADRKRVEELAEELRAERRAVLLREALARPGLPEVMRVYGEWEEADRDILRDRPGTGATDHTNIDSAC